MKYTAAEKRYLIGIPFFLLVALALPLMFLLAPVILIACLVVHANPIDAFRLSWNLLQAVRGTQVELSKGCRLVLIHIG